MYRCTATIVVLLSWVLAASAEVGAQSRSKQPPRDSRPLSRVVAAVEAKGRQVTDVDFTQWMWRVYGQKEGRETEYRVTPNTLMVKDLKSRKTDKPVPDEKAKRLSQILSGLENAGFRRFVDVHFAGTHWTVRATRDGETTVLAVDPVTGKPMEEKRRDSSRGRR